MACGVACWLVCSLHVGVQLAVKNLSGVAACVRSFVCVPGFPGASCSMVQRCREGLGGGGVSTEEVSGRRGYHL